MKASLVFLGAAGIAAWITHFSVADVAPMDFREIPRVLGSFIAPAADIPVSAGDLPWDASTYMYRSYTPPGGTPTYLFAAYFPSGRQYGIGPHHPLVCYQVEGWRVVDSRTVDPGGGERVLWSQLSRNDESITLISWTQFPRAVPEGHARPSVMTRLKSAFAVRRDSVAVTWRLPGFVDPLTPAYATATRAMIAAIEQIWH